MFCNNCGAKVNEGVKFCPSCGKELGTIKKEAVSKTVEETYQKVSPKKNKVYINLGNIGSPRLLTLAGAAFLSIILIVLLSIKIYSGYKDFCFNGYRATNLYPINEVGKLGFIDGKGNIKIKPSIDGWTWGFNDGVSLVINDSSNKAGLINKNGIYITTPDYDYKTNKFYDGWYTDSRFQIGLSDGLIFIGEKNSKYVYVNKDGKPVLSINKDGDMYPGCFSYALAAVEKGNKWGFMDEKGNLKIPAKYDLVKTFSQELSAVKVGDKWGFINKSGIMVINPIYDDALSFCQSRAAVKLKDKWGFIDRKGKAVTAFDYENVNNFSQGLAAVEKGGKWGFVDLKGKLVIDNLYESCWMFNEGLCPVYKDGKWGYINSKNKLIIDPKFEHANVFISKLAYVYLDGKACFISKNGNNVWQATK